MLLRSPVATALAATQADYRTPPYASSQALEYAVLFAAILIAFAADADEGSSTQR